MQPDKQTLKEIIIELVLHDESLREGIKKKFFDELATKNELFSVIRSVEKKIESVEKKLQQIDSRIESVQLLAHEEIKELRREVIALKEEE